jgi:tetratricopeptide (TPR) repeat protein
MNEKIVTQCICNKYKDIISTRAAKNHISVSIKTSKIFPMYFYKKSVFFIFACSYLLAGCSIISSSIQYTKGTECLERGDCQGAIQHLEKAVELNPTYASNQGNLACAYIAAGEIEKAWLHSRKAVLCNNSSEADLFTFVYLCHMFIEEKGVLQKGISLEDVLCELGEPDARFERDDRLLGLVYGRCILTFYDEKLIDYSMYLREGV